MKVVAGKIMFFSELLFEFLGLLVGDRLLKLFRFLLSKDRSAIFGSPSSLTSFLELCLIT